MSNLVPEKRLNKHGVLVTKHVRAENTQGTLSAPLPAPSVSTPLTTKDAAISEILKNFADSYSGDSLTERTVAWQEILEGGLPSLSAEVVESYREAIVDNDNMEGFEELLISVLQHENSSSEAGYILFVAQQVRDQEVEWVEDGLGTYTYYRFSKIANGLKSMSEGFTFDVPSNIYDADEQQLSAIAALVKVTSTVHSLNGDWGLTFLYDDETGDETGYTLDNVALIELVAEYPERADQIGELIYDRETTDGDAIRTILESGHTSLSEGAL